MKFQPIRRDACVQQVFILKWGLDSSTARECGVSASSVEAKWLRELPKEVREPLAAASEVLSALESHFIIYDLYNVCIYIHIHNHGV